MSAVTTNRQIDLTALGFPATMRSSGDGTYEVQADKPATELQAAVDAAPSVPDPVVTEQKRSIVDQAITDAIANLLILANANALPVVPDGTMTTAQLSNALRTLRNEAQATRAGAQKVALTLANKIRLDRGDFAHLDD